MRAIIVALIWLLFFAAGCAILGTKGEGKIEYKTLQVGAKAPDFWLKNQDQQRVSLSDFEGKKNVILVFFPLAFTPVWTGELGEYRESYSLLKELDTEVFGISVDSWASLKKYKDELNLPFDLLSDWERDTAKKYGAYNEKEGVANRKSLLVNSRGIIRFVQESGLNESRKHEEMLDAARKLEDKSHEDSLSEKEAAKPVDAIFYEFYSETCSHCQRMKPVVEEFRKEHEHKFEEFLLIPRKGSDNYALFHEYGVTGTPTFVITDAEGKEIDRMSGEHSLEALVSFTNNAFKRMRQMQEADK